METDEFHGEALDTRTRLILVAERLFGERGIDAVPLREIVTASGQRNASALAYHIGGREELVHAILQYRRAEVDARRVALLDDYAASKTTMDETAIAAAVILPLIELMLRDPRGGNYLRFLSQAYVTDRPDAAYRASGAVDAGMRRCFRLYRARYQDPPAARVRERFAVCARGAMYAMADWQRDAAAARSSIPRSPLPGFGLDLIAVTASCLASIAAPMHRFRPFVAPASADMQEAG
jgi:AcrR family transcriptional regulator